MSYQTTTGILVPTFADVGNSSVLWVLEMDAGLRRRRCPDQTTAKVPVHCAKGFAWITKRKIILPIPELDC